RSRPAPGGRRHGEGAGKELRLIADHHGMFLGHHAQHVARRSATQPQTATLSHGVAVDALMLAHGPPLAVAYFAPLRDPALALHEAADIAVRHEAQLLRVWLLCIRHGEPH